MSTTTYCHNRLYSFRSVIVNETDVSELRVPGLIRPPGIELLLHDIELKDGHLEGCIQISTSEVYGVTNVLVILEDDRGNIIESGYALDAGVVENHWGYFPSAPLPTGTTIIVRAIAMDPLGGVGIKTERITVGNKADQLGSRRV